MARTPLFDDIHRELGVARFCEARRLSTDDGRAIADEIGRRCAGRRRTRREWLQFVGSTGLVGAVASVASRNQPLRAAAASRASARIAIVGAGLAGLACADALAERGIVATVYDANERTGGRCWSLRGFFPGQVAERGGEFIDTPHKTMLRYAKRFGLALEDVTKKAGETSYFFDGRAVAEAEVIEEFRAFVPVLHADLRRLSNEVTALSPTSVDMAVDRTSLAEYLDGSNALGIPAGPIAKAAITSAYLGEYGLETDEQSCLNLLMFIHADRRSKFTPFGVFSDERYHVADGNDRIVEGLTAALPRSVQLGMQVVAARRTGAGAIELTFAGPGAPPPQTHDVVVFAIPFTVLRTVALDASLGIPAAQRAAIDNLGYGANAKLLVGFDGRPWAAQGSNGTAYSDLPDHQLSWETNRVNSSASRAVVTDYASGDRGASLDPALVQAATEAFLDDFDRVYPGAAAVASRRGDGSAIAHLEHWPSNPLALGSYTCYRPGQFTSIAGLEGAPAGNVYFAGEHANSFYEWQGFMEGAALSGVDVAAAILRGMKKAG
ncbi:MAG TPA: NAD(P)/FAD-dependent oxidoreductase [Vicinamibacterales bacterium]|nr:NAD(P)/FAD-dependent oxidoreductase [Vicinamibacterales bacterium]